VSFKSLETCHKSYYGSEMYTIFSLCHVRFFQRKPLEAHLSSLLFVAFIKSCAGWMKLKMTGEVVMGTFHASRKRGSMEKLESWMS
jgi:hypothetical protein